MLTLSFIPHSLMDMEGHILHGKCDQLYLKLMSISWKIIPQSEKSNYNNSIY